MAHYNVTKRSVERRNAEIAAIERGSRFWKSYDPAGSFLARVNPKAISTRDKRRSEAIVVYLLRFRSRTNPVYSFLKIGITNHMPDRFGFDSHRYETVIVAQLHGLKRREALKVEKRLHQMFEALAHRPRVPLMSKGDTECFEDNADIIDGTKLVFSAFKQELEIIRPYNSTG